jgi:hypothetical protein
MTTKEYFGKGDSIQGAIGNLYKEAKKDGIDAKSTEQISDLEFTLKIGEHTFSHTDQHLAYAGIFQTADIKVSEYDPKENPLEVSVKGTFNQIPEEKPKPKARSPGLDSYISTELTNDF